MAKSSISADVKAANSKLATFLRKQEEEEMLLQIGKRKPKAPIEEKRMPGGRAKWAIEPDFKAPSCQVDRPRSVTGATSFHFSYISISKQDVPTLNGKPIGASGRAKEPALEHSKYIERDGAAELSAGAKHAAYIERDGAIETSGIDPSALASEMVERTIAAVINESPTEQEASILGVRDFASPDIPSVFSNISDNPFERQEYWRAVERCERMPKVHEIILDPDTSSRWWAALEASEHIDPAFKNHALLVLNDHHLYEKKLASTKLGDAKRKPFSAKPWIVSSQSAGKVIEQSMRMPGYDHSAPPLEFKSGRGGRVQNRFVAELPHEITAEDRALIAQNFCDHLGSLDTVIDENGNERSIGMMYTAVIHEPDAHNDDRNYHLHIVAHDRPARFLEDEGMWDFEIKEHFNIKGMDRVRYPHRQNKIGEIARAGNGANYETAGKNFIPAMRREFSKITNAVLKARGIERRYDPRKYTEMGIDREPTQHLGTKASALEAIGVPTTVGQLNAIAIWSDAERSIEKQAKANDKAYKESQNKLVKLADQVTSHSPFHPELIAIRKLISTRDDHLKSLVEDRRSIMAFDHMEAKAKSRAVRTRQTCQQLLLEIDEGNSSGTNRVMRYAVVTRLNAAQEHLDNIDKALAPHRDALREAAEIIQQRELAVTAIDENLKPLIASLKDILLVPREVIPNREITPTREVAPSPEITPKSIETPAATPAPAVDRAVKSLASNPDKHHQPTPPIIQEAAPTPTTLTDRMPAPAPPIIHEAAMAPTVVPTEAKASPVNSIPTPEIPKPAKQDLPLQASPSPTLPSADKPILPRADPLKTAQATMSPDIAAKPIAVEKAQATSGKPPVTLHTAPEIEITQPLHETEAASIDTIPSVEAEEVTPMHVAQPIKIGGVPIVPPTLDPRPLLDVTQQHAVNINETGTPEGLQPLRPVPTAEDVAPTASFEISNVDTAPQNIDDPATENGSAKLRDDTPARPLEDPVQPKVDRRKKVEEPTLFELGEQAAPIKPGTAKADHADWDALIERVSKERLQVNLEKRADGSSVFVVPHLSQEENDLIHNPRFAKRTNARMSSIHETQQREISRLKRWFKEHVSDPNQVQFIGRSIQFTENAPKAIETLMGHWGAQTEIRELLISEYGRRIELHERQVRMESNAAAMKARGDTRSISDMIENAAARYPNPEDINNPLVAEFARLLQELSPDDILREAATKIEANFVARNAVHRSKTSLVKAYELYSGELDRRLTQERQRKEREEQDNWSRGR